jgi:hypothetical protein
MIAVLRSRRKRVMTNSSEVKVKVRNRYFNYLVVEDE